MVGGLVFLFFLLSCKPESPPPDLGAPPSQGEESLHLLEDLPPIPKIHPILLNSQDFMIPGIRVGIQSYLLSETPVLTFERPKAADWVSILRCPGNSVIVDGSYSIESVEGIHRTLEESIQIWRSHRFWDAALTMGRCELIAGAHSSSSFEDALAPSGRFFYILRPCIAPERLLKPQGMVPLACSGILGLSPVLNFQNQRPAYERDLLKKAAEQKEKIESLGQSILWKTQALYEELLVCQKEQKIQVASQAEGEAMTHLITLGVSVGLGAVALGTTRKIPASIAAAGGVGAITGFIATYAQTKENPSYSPCPKAFRLKSEIQLLGKDLAHETAGREKEIKSIDLNESQ
jgi:hypothetical protein